MNELLVCLAITLSATSGLFSLVGKVKPMTDRFFAIQMGVGASVGLLGAVRGLLDLKTETLQTLRRYFVTVWHVQVDCLSSLFLVSIFLLGGIGALYGSGYFSVVTRGYEAVRLRVYFGIFVAGMALLVVANHAIIFLFGWEIMALFAFMALTVQDKKEPVRQAGFVYLVATRIGTLALIAMFALLRVQSGSFSLNTTGLDANSGLATATFLLGLLGFGMKAGIMPLHFWLPAAHANAPTHVSAIMSGVMIKTGIYGILRLTSFYGDIPTWWGHLVLVLGLVSALLGVAFALGQHDIKRLLAYHSVENIGIILLGISVGLIGRNKSEPILIFLGFGGALLHVLNHGLFKALLFFGAGAVISATGTRELERYGALSRRMPYTATAFLIGAIAISGLPPLNGFVSEIYVYLGMFSAQIPRMGLSATALAFAIPVLATVGALALACFIKVYTVVFLGKSRNLATEHAKEGPWSVLLPQGVLALGCILIGLFAQAPWFVLRGAVFCLAGRLPNALGKNAISIVDGLKTLSIVHGCLAVVAVTLVFAWWRTRSKSPIRTTWDCGFVGPSARVQYTASSIADDLVAMFATVLRPKVKVGVVRGVFPQPVSFSSHVPEVILELVLLPLLHGLVRVVAWLRLIQRGAVHLYLFYVLLTLVVMLAVWR
jgi:hydrogenase-4 component B